MIKARQINISLILFLPLILSASFRATGRRGGLQTRFKDSLLYICIIVLFCLVVFCVGLLIRMFHKLLMPIYVQLYIVYICTIILLFSNNALN